jgi:hypothetical protein
MNMEFLNLVKSPQKRTKVEMRKNGGDESNLEKIYIVIYITYMYIKIYITYMYVYIHIYMTSPNERTSHNEALCIAILNKQKCLFSKTEHMKIKQVLCGGWYQWEGGGFKERV